MKPTTKKLSLQVTTVRVLTPAAGGNAKAMTYTTTIRPTYTGTREF